MAKKIKSGFDNEIQTELARLGNIKTIMLSGLPPKIKIHNKTKNLNHQDFILDYSVQDIGGGIGKIEFRINNSLVASTNKQLVDLLYSEKLINLDKNQNKWFFNPPFDSNLNIISLNNINEKRVYAFLNLSASYFLNNDKLKAKEKLDIIKTIKTNRKKIVIDLVVQDLHRLEGVWPEKGKLIYEFRKELSKLIKAEN